MKDEYMVLIQKLADKLGTTAEHLYGVLVMQAPISAAIDVITALIMVLLLVFFIKTINRLTLRPPATDAERYPSAIITDEAAIALMWTGVAIFGIVTMAVSFSSLNSVVTAILNPEYWAISQILK